MCSWCILLIFGCVSFKKVSLSKDNFDKLENTEEDIFGEVTPRTIKFLPRITYDIPPPNCSDSAAVFCENVDTYPYREIEKILRKNKVPLFFFGADDPPKNDPVTRLAEAENSWFLCSSESKVIRPRIGLNRKNQWRLIINQEKTNGFIQAIRIEVCKNPNNPCKIFGDLPNGDLTICKQKYVYRSLISVDGNGRPVPDMFKLPSACSCAYKTAIDFLKSTNYKPNRNS